MHLKSAQSTVEGRTLKGFIFGILQFLTNLVYSIVLVPLFIEYWGVEKYSIWLLIFAFVMIMRTVDLGHQNFVGNEFNKMLFKDKDLAIQILRSSTWVAVGIGFLELLIFIGLDLAGLTPIVTGITEPNFIQESRIGILYFLIVWLMVGSVGGIVARVLLPLGYYTHTVILGIALKVLEIIVILVATVNKFSITNLCLWLSLSYLIQSIYVFWHVKKLLPDIFPLWKGANTQLGIKNFFKSIGYTITGSVEQLNVNGVVLLISSLISSMLVPAFTTLRTVSNLFMQPLMLVMGPLQPELTRYHMQNCGNKIEQIVYTSWFINAIVVGIPMILITPFLSEIYHYWINGSMLFNMGMFWLLAVSVLLINYGKTFQLYLSGINNLKAVLLISTVRFVLIFGTSLILYHSLGWYAMGIGIVMAEVVCSILLPLLFVNRELQRMGSGIKMSIAALGILPVIVNVFLAYSLTLGLSKGMLTGAALVLMVILCYMLWRQIELEVRERLFALIKLKVNGR